MRREVPRAAREVLDRDVLEPRPLADEELDRGVRVGNELGCGRGVLLDQAEARALLRDNEEAPEKRGARSLPRQPDVERLLELDPLRDVNQQAVLPRRRVVGRAERVETRVLVRQSEHVIDRAECREHDHSRPHFAPASGE